MVIPNDVDLERTLSLSGTADNYTIRWTPSLVQHGTVYYIVALQSSSLSILEEVGNVVKEIMEK